MSLKISVGGMLDEFKLGKFDIDMSYRLNADGSVSLTSFSIHEPWEWDGKRDPVYISFNVTDKSISLSSLSYSDLNDPTINIFFQLPEGFGDF